MSTSIKITVPGIQDLEYYRKIGHIVFRMDQLKDDEAIKRTLFDHFRETKGTSKEKKIVTTTIEQLNKELEI